MPQPVNVELLMTNVFINLLRKHFFYGSVLSQLNKVYTDKVRTLAVGKESKEDTFVKLFISPSYINEVADLCNRDEEKVMAHFTEVMKHEVHHFIFGHLNLDYEDKVRQSIACELSVNSYIDRKNLIPAEGETKAGVFPEDFKLETKLSAKEYYDLLNHNDKYQKMMFDARQELQDLLDGKFGKEAEKILGRMIDNHGLWKPISGDAATGELLKDIIRQANETCKQIGRWGDMPGELIAAIQKNYEMERNIIPWQVVLKNFLASSSENVLDYTMKRKSKRYGTRPGTKKDDILSVGIGIDTSGSIDNDAIRLFFSELEWMKKANTKMTVFEWDTQVNREYPFKQWDGTATGRGGTNPVPALEMMSERKFDCIIMFTDFGFEKIEKRYGIPMMWVVTDPYTDFNEDSYIPVSEGMIFQINKDHDGFEVIRQ